MQDDPDKQLQVLRELAKSNVEYVPFDEEVSTDRWTVSDGRLIGPLQNIIGLGPKSVNDILSVHVLNLGLNRRPNEGLSTKLLKKLQNAKTKLDSLTPIRTKMMKFGLETKGYFGQIVDIDRIELTGDWIRDVHIAGLVTKVATRDENEARRVEDRLARGDIGLKSGATKFLEIRVTDDSGTYFVKIGAKDFEKRANVLTEKLKENKTYIVARGTIPPSAPVMLNDAIWILGEE